MRKSTNNKTKLMSSITIVLLLASVFMTLYTPVQAQYVNQGGQPLPPGVTPDYTVDTTAYLGFTPNPVGVGQTILVNMWTTPALHRSRYHTGYKVTITHPDGKEDIITMDSYPADATAWFEYPVNEVGTWKLKFDFPGSYFPPANVSGGYREPPIIEIGECYYTPSSTAEMELVVQEDMVYSWPPSPLPTDYWTRPVRPEHREWVSILGDYPWYGPGGGPDWPAETNIYGTSRYRFTPYVQAPNTAHIVWKKQDNIAGIMGAGLTSPVEYRRGRGNAPNIILAGRCYDTYAKPGTGSDAQTYWQCYDLRTGEVFWERPLEEGESAPNIVEYEFGGVEVPGAEARAGAQAYLVRITSPSGGESGRLIKYNPWNGEVDVNVTGPPPGVTAGTYYMNQHVLSIQNLGGGNRRLINWTTKDDATDSYGFGIPDTDDFDLRIRNNITWPWSNLGDSQDFESMIAVDTAAISPPEVRAWVATEIRAASLITGQELWVKTVDVNYFSSSCTVADHGKVAWCTINRYWVCHDLQTGNQVWTSELADFPWGCWWTYDVSSAYGMIYCNSYAGVYAFDWDDGTIVWNYKHQTPFAYESPYAGEYSFRADIYVADGKVYTSNTEHTPTAPITRGWRFHCIDAFTGEGLWNVLGEMRPGPMADGYITAESYDGYMYVFGKGKSETTVTAPDVAVPKGTALTIKGTVLDMSPAQTGTPCVSKESMNTQMDYLHMQGPIDGIDGNAVITGVPVALTAFDEDGEYVDIGTTTTDGYSGAFGHAWTPPEEGIYKIIASFEGDDSYASSSAATYVTVGPAPAVDGQIEPEPTFAIPIEIAAIAVIIVVAIIALAAVYIIRKRK